MAEFITDTKHNTSGPVIGNNGFSAFGKKVLLSRKSQGLRHLEEMGVTNTETATDVVDKVANKIERDQPYEAFGIAMEYVDLTGAYRLIAALCVDEV